MVPLEDQNDAQNNRTTVIHPMNRFLEPESFHYNLIPQTLCKNTKQLFINFQNVLTSLLDNNIDTNFVTL